jgi:hypothetical protein
MAGLKGEMHEAVLDFEALAEDTYDKALSGDAGGVHAAAASIQSRWKKLRKTVVRAGLKEASARALDRSVARLVSLSASAADTLQLARAANAVTDTMDDIFALYHPKAAAKVTMPDEAAGQTNDGQHQKVEEGQTGVQGKHGQEGTGQEGINEADGPNNHGGELGSVETVGAAAEGASGASSTNV